MNNHYAIIRTVVESTTSDGIKIPINTFHVVDPTNELKGAYFLHYLLNDLQSLANLSSHMVINHGNYPDNSLSDFS